MSIAMNTASTAVAVASCSCSRGQRRATKAAAAAASSPRRARVAEGVAEQGAGERGEVPEHEDGEPGLPEPESLGPRLGLGDADGGRLVDRQLGGGEAPAAPVTWRRRDVWRP